MPSYIENLRTKIGHDKFIHPAARIIVENEKGEILFIRRTDNGKLGIPAGGLEEAETIEECMRREVLEEAGVEIIDLEVIGIRSNPKTETVYYPNKDVVQYFTVEFYSNTFKGNPRPDQLETTEALFLSDEFISDLPDNERRTFESLAYFRRTGKVLLN